MSRHLVPEQVCDHARVQALDPTHLRGRVQDVLDGDLAPDSALLEHGADRLDGKTTPHPPVLGHHGQDRGAEAVHKLGLQCEEQVHLARELLEEAEVREVLGVEVETAIGQVERERGVDPEDGTHGLVGEVRPEVGLRQEGVGLDRDQAEEVAVDEETRDQVLGRVVERQHGERLWVLDHKLG